MRKSSLSYLSRILAVLCLLSSYLWIAPGQAHALSVGSQEYSISGSPERTNTTGKATAGNQMIQHGPWKNGYKAGLLNPVQLATASAKEQAQPQTFALSFEEPLRPTVPLQADNPSLSVLQGDLAQTHSGSNPSAPLQQGATTTLTVNIIGSPWATLDSNNPGGIGEQVPKVLVVEAVITNTGTTTATGVTVNLNYNEDPDNNWVLLPGEDPDRAIDSLAPGAAYHAYWFASYSTVIGASHQYTVTADAENANLVATSNNYYGNPEPGKTVKTRSTTSTGNSGVSQTIAEIVVGVAFTMTVTYDLGSNPNDALFSPVGNTDFDPSAYRLLASEVRFYNDSQTQQSTVTDRLYFPAVPSFADNAQVTFVFIALTASNAKLCSYTAIGYSSNDKYDQFYCDPDKGTIVSITGTLTLSLTKQVSNLTIQQNQPLTYTLRYTNTGQRPLSYVWIWDDVNTDIGSIITTTINPSSDLDETTDSRVAWYLGTVPASGQAGSTGTLTFTILVDGDGQDLADGTLAVNHAFFGINQDSLPQKTALTSTVTTTVQAPTLTLSKTDGRATAEPSDALTYTLRITNSGSIAATGLVITDVLPADVNYASGTATPPETSRNGQTLVWTSLGPIAPGGGTVVITIPVTVGAKVLNGTILADTMTVKYQNPAGWVFATRTAADTTTVNAPVLTISKSDYPDPVLTGGLITYTLRYTNSGLVAADNVLITDVVPVSTTYQSCSGGSACGMSNGVVSWTISTVPSNTNSTVSFSVLVSDALVTGEVIRNEDYGIIADQTNFIPGPPLTTQVNRNAGFIAGYTFIDANGDGVYDDATEGTLSGVVITLTSATVQVTTTDSGGRYRFRVETEEPVSLSAALPTNYFRTTPGIVVYLESVLGITKTLDFGYAPVTSTFGVIYGTVFEDTNQDENQDLGEDGLSGVTVTSAEAAASPVTTNDLGQYTFRYNAPGTVTITETNPQFYVSTTPDVIQTDVVTGSSNGSPKDFGDFLGVKITGQVFNDANVDGVKDGAEGGVSGATVAADGDSTSTGSTGVYTLYVAVSGSNPITVTETDPAAYVSTNAVPGTGMSRVDANTLRITSPISGQVYSGDFGDVQTAHVVTVSGQVWNDNGAGGGSLANGLRDGAEPGLSGAIVSLSSGLTQTTSADGLFLLYGPPNRVITVTETNPDGYISTNAVPGTGASKVDNDTLRVSALISALTSANNLFGDVLASSVAIITGTVFDDGNENGVFDGGEAGKSGVTVTLQISGDNTITVPTDSSGQYQFAVAPGDEVRITSAGPGGDYYPTTAESITMHPPTAGVYPGNNFGYSDDTDVAVILGLVFDDVDSDGQPDFGEPGLAGAVVTLALNGNPLITTTTSITGTFTFTVTQPVTQPVVYSLHEANPPGYRSTTPDEINVSVRPGVPSYYVEFGDTNNLSTASLYGLVFEDENGNGLQDSGEIGLAGVVVSVTVGGGTGVLTATTRSYGQYNYGFDLAEAGYHTVSEQDLTSRGYRSTTPDEVNVLVVLGSSYIVNFGDIELSAPYATIIGAVFDDDSGDGVQDLGELGIQGVLISLSNGLTTTTDSNGSYTFAISDTGFVRVVETDPTGYHSTTPNTVTVNVADVNQVYVVDFGDRADSAYGSSFFGTVFNDQNANGLRDLTELGLSGVTVTINTIGGTPNPSILTTNEWGQYTFLIEIAGTYTVTASDLPGYVSTCAIPGDPTVTKVDNNILRAALSVSGTDMGDNLFGDALASQIITISGYVWDDNGAGGGIAGDGVWNGSEPGLAEAVVSLSSGMSQTTASDGAFLLYAPSGQAITVTETNPTGYASTNAVPGNNASKVNNDTLVVMGLSGGGESSNNRFGDAQAATLELSKTAVDVNGAPLVVSDTIRYTLQVTNTGTYTAYNVTVIDNLPDQITCRDVSGDSAPAGCADPLVWSIPSLAPYNTVASLVITVTIDPGSEGQTITNTGNVTGTNVPNPPDDPTPVCPDGSPLVGGICPNTPVPTTTLSISKGAEDVNGPPLVVSDTIRYTLRVTNTGTYTAYNVTVTDDLPAGVTYEGASADLGTPTGTDPVIWTIPGLPSSVVATLFITVTINSDQAGQTITNTGSVTCSNVFDPPDDPPPICPDGSLPVGGVCTNTPVQSADLGIDKAVDDATPGEGDTVVYTVTVTNNGPGDVTSLVISDPLPGGVTRQAHSTSQGTYTPGTGVWDGISLVAENVAILTITATVDAGTTGQTITNTAVISASDQYDSNSGNDSDNAPITVTSSGPGGVYLPIIMRSYRP